MVEAKPHVRDILLSDWSSESEKLELSLLPSLGVFALCDGEPSSCRAFISVIFSSTLLVIFPLKNILELTNFFT